MEPSEPRGDEVIPLSRWRAVIARARRGRRLEALVHEPDAARLVAALPVQELHYLVREVGLEDAAEALALATPSQIRGLVDFDAWDRDHLVPDKLDPWIDALVDQGPARLAAALGGLDQEALAFYLAARLRVYDLSLEAPPEEPEGHFYPTPDRFFLLDILPAGEAGKRVERLIDWLYRADLQYGRRILMATRWELPSDLEETAYRWRSGRMADLGFVDYYEALEVYRWLDPLEVRVGEGSATLVEAQPLPAALAEGLGEGSLLGRALAGISDGDTLDRVQGTLLALINRVMSADRAEPGDVAAAEAALARVRATLELGLEFLARAELARAVTAVETVALVRIFRVGFSLTIKLKQAADTLVERGWVTLVPGQVTLLDPPLRDVVVALRRPRPEHAGGRPFASLAEVSQAARALERAAALGPLLRDGLGVDPRVLEPDALAGTHPPRDLLTFDLLGATLAANVLLDRPASLVPLRTSDLATLRERALTDGTDGEPPLRPTARLAVRRALDERITERERTAPPDFEEIVDGWLRALEHAVTPAAVAAPAALPDAAVGLLTR